MKRVFDVLELIEHKHAMIVQIVTEMGLMRLNNSNVLVQNIDNQIDWSIVHNFEPYTIVDAQIVNGHLVFAARPSYNEDTDSQLFSLTLEGVVNNEFYGTDRGYIDCAFEEETLSITKIKILDRSVKNRFEI